MMKKKHFPKATDFKLKYIIMATWLVVFCISCKSNTRVKIAKEKADNLLEMIVEGNATNEFSTKHFPIEQTNQIIYDLKEHCDFANRQGQFINDFYHKNLSGTDQVSFIYEFYLKCDSIRFILTYNLGKEIELSGFNLESIKKNNPMILNPERRLKY